MRKSRNRRQLVAMIVTPVLFIALLAVYSYVGSYILTFFEDGEATLVERFSLALPLLKEPVSYGIGFIVLVLTYMLFSPDNNKSSK